MPRAKTEKCAEAGKDVVAQLQVLERQGEDYIWRTALAAREEIESLRLTIICEQEARWKLEAAYRQKDAAVSRLMEMCQLHGIDLSHLIP